MTETKKLYYSISEVSKRLGVKPHVLRYWETQFRWLRPKKNRAGNRSYQQKDLDLLEQIRELLYDRRFTIEGARKEIDLRRANAAKGGDPTSEHVGPPATRGGAAAESGGTGTGNTGTAAPPPGKREPTPGGSGVRMDGGTATASAEATTDPVVPAGGTGTDGAVAPPAGTSDGGSRTGSASEAPGSGNGADTGPDPKAAAARQQNQRQLREVRSELRGLKEWLEARP